MEHLVGESLKERKMKGWKNRREGGKKVSQRGSEIKLV